MQAYWTTLISPIELKTNLQSEDAYKAAVGQV
jgi:hypothetical protein